MRKATLAMIIFWSILALLLVGALVAGLVLPRTRPGSVAVIGGADGPTAIYTTEIIPGGQKVKLFDQSYPIDNVKTFTVDLTSDEVDIYAAEGSEVRIVQHGINLQKERVIMVEQGSSSLTVRHVPQRVSNWFNVPKVQRSYVEIYLPESYRQALSLDLTSGSVMVHDDREYTDFRIDITSGDIITQGTKATSAAFDLTSGSIAVSRLETDSFLVDSTSGHLQVGDLTGSGSIDMTSGDVILSRVQLTGRLTASLTSGTVNIGLTGDPGLRFFCDKTSGTVNTYFPVNKDEDGDLSAAVGSDPQREISIDMTSGTVNITQVQ